MVDYNEIRHREWPERQLRRRVLLRLVRMERLEVEMCHKTVASPGCWRRVTPMNRSGRLHNCSRAQLRLGWAAVEIPLSKRGFDLKLLGLQKRFPN